MTKAPSGPFDVVIVGSGAGGGIAAYVLATAGARVLVLEKGPWNTKEQYGDDELRFGDRNLVDEDPLIEPRTFRDSPVEGDHSYVGDVLDCSRGVGGGSVHYGAVCFRFRQEDFRVRSTWGDLAGADLADWPLTEAELDPSNPASIWDYYRRTEKLIGVAGGQMAGEEQPGSPVIGSLQERTDPYPMAGHPPNYPAHLFVQASAKLGYHPFPTPVAINNGAYQGRPGCSYCGFCSGYGCPIEAKGDTRVTALALGLATGNLAIRPDTVVTRVEVSKGLARGVSTIDSNGKSGFVAAPIVILAASTVDTPRLALLSDLPGNLVNRDLIGAYLMVHHYPAGIGVFEDRVDFWRGYWSMRCLDDFYFGLPGTRMFGYGNVQTVGPSGGARSVAGTGGVISLAKTVGWGAAHKPAMEMLFGHMQFLSMIGQDPPVRTNRVDLDPTVKDVYGLPVARITYSHHPNDLVVQAAMIPVLMEILVAMGAVSTQPAFTLGAPTAIPQMGNQEFFQRGPLRGVPDTIGGMVNHQMGTMRMGDHPDTSVLDPNGRFWGIPNLYVTDGSVFPSSGGYNPTLTIQAMAWRTATAVVAAQGRLR